MQILVLPMALGIAACSSTPGAAATFNGTTISNASFTRELDALKNNKKLAEAATQKGYSVATDGKINPRLAAQWLAADIEQIPVDQEFARRKLTISEESRSTAKAHSAEQLGSLAVLEAFPKWFQTLLVERQARVEALIESFTAEDGYANDAAWFAANSAAAAEYCPSGKVVRHILVKTREDADAVTAALGTGAAFEQLAIDRSTDPGSQGDGGFLGCVETGRYVAPFEQAMLALGAGETSGPVQTEYGFHIIRVETLTATTASKTVRALRQRVGGQKFSAWLDEQIASATITVDPRWGTVTTQGGLTITPPSTSTTSTPRSTPATMSGSEPSPSTASSPATSGR
ncbi:MAG: peptidylprolyl isomerase [Acidimicrobiia bacterium]